MSIYNNYSFNQNQIPQKNQENITIEPIQNDPTSTKIEEKTKPIFRILAFLAGLAILGAGITFMALTIGAGSPLILLIPIVFPFSLFGLPCIGFAINGTLDEPCAPPILSDDSDQSYAYQSGGGWGRSY